MGGLPIIFEVDAESEQDTAASAMFDVRPLFRESFPVPITPRTG